MQVMPRTSCVRMAFFNDNNDGSIKYHVHLKNSRLFLHSKIKTFK